MSLADFHDPFRTHSTAPPFIPSPDPSYSGGTSAPLWSPAGEPTREASPRQAFAVGALTAMSYVILALSAVGLFQLARRLR